MRVEDFKRDINKAASLVSTAQRLLRQGQVVDLAALESHVKELTLAAQDLSQTDRDSARVMIVSLMHDLDALHKELANQHADLEQQLKGMSQTSRAMQAYGASKTLR